MNVGLYLPISSTFAKDIPLH